ncbi:MAG: hypothetical protein QOH58_528, partial [Thermoleophilaceae bacterium]|nr:hypothetical protein [Thermoleophilaceae bacterium]
ASSAPRSRRAGEHKSSRRAARSQRSGGGAPGCHPRGQETTDYGTFAARLAECGGGRVSGGPGARAWARPAGGRPGISGGPGARAPGAAAGRPGISGGPGARAAGCHPRGQETTDYGTFAAHLAESGGGELRFAPYARRLPPAARGRKPRPAANRPGISGGPGARAPGCHQFCDGSGGIVASRRYAPPLRCSARDQMSSSLKGSSASASATTHASCSSSPSSWPAPQPA